MQNKAKAEVLLLIGAFREVLDNPSNFTSKIQLNNIQRKLEYWAYENLVDLEIPGIFKIIEFDVGKKILD